MLTISYSGYLQFVDPLYILEDPKLWSLMETTNVHYGL